jgi:hypothetical protein
VLGGPLGAVIGALVGAFIGGLIGGAVGWVVSMRFTFDGFMKGMVLVVVLPSGERMACFDRQ